MAPTLPKSDLSRFSPVSPELLALSYLSCQKQGLSLAVMQQRLKKLLAPATVDRAVSRLIEHGDVSLDKVVTITSQGRKAAKQKLGHDSSKDWESLTKFRFPCLALGLDPDQPDVRKRYAKPDALKAAAVAVAYGLHQDAMVSLKAAASELVWQLVRAGLGDVVGKGPFPMIEEPGILERVLLSGFAGGKAKSMPEAMTGVAARALGIDKVDGDTLRARLIQIGVAQFDATPSAPPDTAPRVPAPAEPSGFATRVSDVARTLSTPPFQGRVAIAQVYDAYGKVHPDAGSLASFKERLVGAAKARQLDLSRLDLPERMAKDLRLRSETAWDTDQVHFVVVEWK